MEPVLTHPVGTVSMASLFASSEEAIAIATGEAPKRHSLRERWRLLQKKRIANRKAIAQAAETGPSQRSSFLAGKQVVYLERYWKQYLPDEALMGDKEFVRSVLDHAADGVRREKAT